LDNVPYAPACGRYKVYLIDEVHMFSNNSFNALLKTLEEPPPHVKFLLATTDPQKVPVTVLSRCLQLNLRRLLPEEIRARLQHVLETEGIPHEPAALGLLARAADGSMRDGLSLLDQAIAYGGGRVGESDVRDMLGTVAGDLTFDLLDALAAGDGARLLAQVERIGALAPDFAELLKDLLGLLHRLALFQQVPETVPADDPDRARFDDLAGAIAPEDVQLFYQVALTGQPDLALAPDPRSGFEMVLLRALAFRPGAEGQGPRTEGQGPRRDGLGPRTEGRGAGEVPVGAVRPTHSAESSAPPVQMPASLTSTADWQRLVDRLGVGGMASELAHHCGFLAFAEGRLSLSLDPAAEHLGSRGIVDSLRGALEKALGGPLKLEIQVARPNQETPAQRRTRGQDERRQAALDAMESDPVAQRVREQLDAQWVPGSIEPTT
jgi:DNA polymerase III subunit gamma/tau